MRKVMADPPHFQKDSPPNCTAHLALAIAAHTTHIQSKGKSQIPTHNPNQRKEFNSFQLATSCQ